MSKVRKKKKHLVSNLLIVLLFISGIGIMAFPEISNWVEKIKLSKEISQYHEVVDGVVEDYSIYWEPAEQYNHSLLDKRPQLVVAPEEIEYVSTLLNPLGNGMMGNLTIEKIGVNLPIYQGTKDKELQTGVGYWLGSSLPTGGENTHCVLTAHTGLVKAKMFTDLDKMEIGDTFHLEVLDRKMWYEVDQIVIKEPDDLTEMYIRPGEDLVTLYTCYPYGVNTHRLLVRGHRIDEPATDKEIVSDWQDFIKENWIWIVLICITVFGTGFLIYKKKRRKSNLS